MSWLPVVVGCSALPVSAVIRSPVDSKCQSYGLKGCPELVEGAIAYADDNKALGMQKLEAARALNTPEQLKPFAEALRTIGKTGPEAAAPLVTVTDILVPSMTAGTAAPALARGPVESVRGAQDARPVQLADGDRVAAVIDCWSSISWRASSSGRAARRAPRRFRGRGEQRVLLVSEVFRV